MTSCFQTLYNVFYILFYILCFANSFSDGTLLHCGGRTRVPIFETWRETRQVRLGCSLLHFASHPSVWEGNSQNSPISTLNSLLKNFILSLLVCLLLFVRPHLTSDPWHHSPRNCHMFLFLGPSCASPRRWLCQCEIPSSSAGWETPTRPPGTNGHVHHVPKPLQSPFFPHSDAALIFFTMSTCVKCTELLPRDCLTNYLF